MFTVSPKLLTAQNIPSSEGMRKERTIGTIKSLTLYNQYLPNI